MKAPWKLALLAVLASIALAAGAYQAQRGAEATPNDFIFGVRAGACDSGSSGDPEITTVSPNSPYCVVWATSSTAMGETVNIAVTNAAGPTLTEFDCTLSFSPICGTAAGDGTSSVTYTASMGAGLGFFGTLDFMFTGCTGDTLSVSLTHQMVTATDTPACEEVGPAPTVDLIAVYPGTCAGLTLPLPPSVTTVVPGADYCIGTTASDHVEGDTHTLASAGVGGPTFDLHVCFTNSAGFDPCLIPPNDPDPGTPHPGPGGTPYVIPLHREDSNSFVGAETDFTFTSCDGDMLTLTYTYDGPGLAMATDTEEIACQGEPPTVNIIAVYPGLCADLTLPLPPTVASVSPGLDYCISTVASDHVAGDTHTLASAGVGGPTFDLHVCFTNSAGFDPCLVPPIDPDPGTPHPGPGGTPYVMPIHREDSNSFLGAETDFSFTSCTEADLTLTYSYDGPGLLPASDMEVIPCTTVSAREFAKYTDSSDEIVLAREVFQWYIDVPDTQGYWEVSDYLPAGFSIVGFVEPDGSCEELWSRSFTCSGTGASSLTIVVTVKAPLKCGDYTNTAKHRTSPTGSWETASDSVRVVGCETQSDDRPRSRNPRNPRT